MTDKKYINQLTCYVEACCIEFEYAFESGTDNEGYGAVAHCYDKETIYIGSGLKPIKYCPWCGKSICDLEIRNLR